jgi:ADP-heptose:LPS heptosyltransferase
MWYHIEKKIKTWILRRLTRTRPEHPLTPDEVDWSTIHHILIIRQHDQFGDFLLTTPAIRAIRLKFPRARIALVVRDYLYPVACNNPDVDEVCILFDSAYKWTPKRIAALIGCIRRPYDLAVVFNTVSHSLSSDMMAYCSRAPIVLGPETPTFDHTDHNPFYSLNAPLDPNPKHQIERNLDVVRYIGADTEDLSYGFALSETEQIEGSKIREQMLGEYSGSVLAIHFGTRDPKKRYPMPLLARVCDGVAETGKYRIIVIPAPDEEELLTQLKNSTQAELYIAPSLALRQVAAFLNTIDLLLCNDTGILHLAAAVRTPTLSFHAISDPALWKPVGSRHVALYAAGGDISGIDVNKVLGVIHGGIDNLKIDRSPPNGLVI